ncbi:hypothetical protein LEP1GSC017_3985 [Leptospira meyeri serovar Hardjo str. Went 5]|nr:hypothetical protein LEP1GSC017_3985 [Leptospira meyeri serovar Hardjo str. Went 5]
MTSNDITNSKTDFDTIPNKNQKIEINFINFPELEKEIEIDFQLIEYTFLDSFKFGSKFKFKEKVNVNNLKIEIPSGIYVGSIEVKVSKTIPFYANYSGIHTIYFGLNEKRIKEINTNEKCNSKEFYSTRKLKSSKFYNFCNDLNILNKKYSINFSSNGKKDFNTTKTFALTYVGVSAGLAKAFQNYQLAPILLISGFFGFVQNDIEINSEILEEAF